MDDRRGARPGAEKLVLLPGGHFDPCLSGFAESSAAARDWFRRHLR
ncbi:hypothetical protein [Nonomuraea sp. CA-141351]